MKLTVFVCMAALIFAGCTRKDDDGYAIYKIPEGKHRSVDRISYFKKNTLSFSASFDETAKYDYYDESLHKLYGFSDCGSKHHNNSARFAWRYFNGKLEIHTYTYIDGEWDSRFIGYANPGQNHQFR